MGRLRAVVIALVVSVVVITLLGALSRLGQPEIWEQSTFNAGRVVMRATLLEISTNPKDPLTARLFGQVLTAAGFAMYAWILAGLFSPSLYSRQHAEEAERERMLALLDEHGSTSEDSFKLWPHDKRYWFNTSDTAGIAYKQHKGFVIGLEAPVGGAHAKSRAATAFRDHCRAHGWKLAWLFADKKSAEVNDLKTLKIGASAVVTIDEFATNTVRNKWWRWVRNKNSKLGLRYDVLTAPFNDTDRGQLKSISTAWLGDNKHSERTFALGYFDETFLTTCTVHVLRNEDGVIIAFANQLPSYHHNTQATIDLMRSSPGYDGAVTYLLSETLLGMYAEGRFKTFDLGFVPLAQNEEAVRKKAVLNLTTTLFNAYFSARGLRQFKNKFEPEWHDTYLAWDGDWLDLPALAQAIDKVLTYTSSNPSE